MHRVHIKINNKAMGAISSVKGVIINKGTPLMNNKSGKAARQGCGGGGGRNTPTSHTLSAARAYDTGISLGLKCWR